jgi:uncharacterized protein (UPF0333 family)
VDTDDKITSAKKNKGFVVVWFVVLLPVVLLFAAMAMDFSYMYVAKGQLQNAADAAALAGAAILIDGNDSTYQTLARTEAVAFAQKNKAAKLDVVIASVDGEKEFTSSNDIRFGYWTADGTFDKNGTYINAIQVRTRRSDTATPNSPQRQVPIIFGKYFGWDRMSTAAVATAAIPARATSSIALCPDFCQGGVSANVMKNYTTLSGSTRPILMDTGPSTPSNNIYAWTSYDSNVTSTSDVRDLICSQDSISRTACGDTIYSSMGNQASSLCNLEAQMYNPYFDAGNKEIVAISGGVSTTAWWMVVPITESCPPGAQGNAWDPKPVIGYAKIRTLAICTTGCGSGSIKTPCSSAYSAPGNVCNLIKSKYGFSASQIHNKMIIDKFQCVDCGSSGSLFPGLRPVLVYVQDQYNN